MIVSTRLVTAGSARFPNHTTYRVVVVHLPKHLLAFQLEAAEVVLVVRVIVFAKVSEEAYLLEHLCLQLFVQSCDASGQHYLAADEAFAKVVVEVAYLWLGIRHVEGGPALSVGRHYPSIFGPGQLFQLISKFLPWRF